MRDTHFFLPPEKRGRLAAVYSSREGRMARGDGPGMEGQGDYVDGPRQCHSGGAGLLSTASDYARFLQMLLNGGQLDGVRLLGPKTVDLMTADHVGPLYPEAGTGFGLGFEVVEHQGRAGRYGTPGEYHWGGAYYTAYWVDPREQLIALFMTQLLPRGDIDLEEKWRALVYQAIVGPPRPVTKRP
jgi:CubicO group peptidase (beta-lactamase class C family)